MKQLIRRVTDRVTRALLRPISDRAESQHQQLVAKIERVEKRMEAGSPRDRPRPVSWHRASMGGSRQVGPGLWALESSALE